LAVAILSFCADAPVADYFADVAVAVN